MVSSSSDRRLRDLGEDELFSTYGGSRFTMSILASRFQYVMEHVCGQLLNNAFSPIIRDFYDFSASLSGGPAQAYQTPAVAKTLSLFFGSMRNAVAISFDEFGVDDIADGDVLIANDPYRVGTHVNDMCFMRPVFVDGELVSVLTIRAHQLDIGGRVPGGFSGMKKDVYENGLVVPPTLLYRNDRPVRSTFSLIVGNSRFGALLLPDIQSIFESLRFGERLIKETIDKYGLAAFKGAFDYACDAAAELMQTALEALPDGDYEGTEYLDCDGADPDEAHQVNVTIRKRAGRAEFDFSGTSVQGRTSLNACWPDALTVVSMALKFLIDPRSPFCSSVLRDVDVVLPRGSVVSAESPAAVMLYWEPMEAAFAAICRALNPVLGSGALAGDARATQIHSVAGTSADGVPWVTALGAVGGWGAERTGDADSGQIGYLMNYFLVEVESLESGIPTVVLRREYETDSGGPGVHRGGAGLFEDTYWSTGTDHQITMASLKTPNGFGADGGGAGVQGGAWMWDNLELGAGTWDRLDDECAHASSAPICGVMDPQTLRRSASGRYYHWAAGDPWAAGEGAWFRVVSGGGGGWGDPRQRVPEAVLADVRDGYVSPEGAASRYGVVVLGDPEIDPEGLSIDRDATASLRAGPATSDDDAWIFKSVAPVVSVARDEVAGDCPECGASALAEYPLVAETGWQRVVKCQSCLAAVSREPWNRLGWNVLLEDTVASSAGPIGNALTIEEKRA
ncbi:hydantoinase B/oxoprolinase family protein [Aeromicrobium sp. CF4.19]|uniref:hydantoinase B/oxoprolinase family protein n=1 Tax=Aeromicrobium sp. CF4.19 TaxID=3373082 RepID=UPI003EE6F8CC